MKNGRSAIEKGIEGIDAEYEYIKEVIQKCLDEGWTYLGGKIAISSVGKGIKGIDVKYIKQAIQECFDKNGWTDPANELLTSAIEKGIEGIDAEYILTSAIEKGIEGIDAEYIKESIQKFFDEGKPDLAGEIAISFSNKYQRLKSSTFLITASKVLDFLFENSLLLIPVLNPFILRKTMDMDGKDFRDIMRSLEELSGTFIMKNKTMEEGRRFDEKAFKDVYIPLAYIMEISLAGSIKYMRGLLHQSPNPYVVIRFLDLKKRALLHEGIIVSFIDFVNRIETRPSRKKIKIDLTGMFKLLNIADSFVWIGNAQSYINMLGEFDGLAKTSDVYDKLARMFLSGISNSLGIENAAVDKNAYEKLFLPFIDRLSQAAHHIETKTPHKLPIFKGLLKSMFEDRFWEFIEDENQPDETAQSIAIHNKKVRTALESKGINVVRWLGKERKERMVTGGFMYYEKGLFKYDPVSDVNAVIDCIKRLAQLQSLSKKQRQQILIFLNSIGIVPEYDKEGNISMLKVEKLTKKKDIVTILSDKKNLMHLLGLIKKLFPSDVVGSIPSLLETVTHTKERVETLIKRLSLDEYQKELKKLRKYFRVRPILRSPGHDLFIGDFTDCCLAMSSGTYPEAMVDRLIDEGMNVIETIDEATGRTIACLWLYIAEDGSLVVQNIEINAEYEKIKPLMDRVAEGMIEYAKEFAEYIGARRLLIGIPGHGKYFGEGGFIKQRYGDKTIYFEKEKIGGYLGEKYYLDSAGKKQAYLVSDFKLIKEKSPGAIHKEDPFLQGGQRAFTKQEQIFEELNELILKAHPHKKGESLEEILARLSEELSRRKKPIEITADWKNFLQSLLKAGTGRIRQDKPELYKAANETFRTIESYFSEEVRDFVLDIIISWSSIVSYDDRWENPRIAIPESVKAQIRKKLSGCGRLIHDVLHTTKLSHILFWLFAAFFSGVLLYNALMFVIEKIKARKEKKAEEEETEDTESKDKKPEKSSKSENKTSNPVETFAKFLRDRKASSKPKFSSTTSMYAGKRGWSKGGKEGLGLTFASKWADEFVIYTERKVFDAKREEFLEEKGKKRNITKIIYRVWVKDKNSQFFHKEIISKEKRLKDKASKAVEIYLGLGIEDKSLKTSIALRLLGLVLEGEILAGILFFGALLGPGKVIKALSKQSEFNETTDFFKKGFSPINRFFRVFFSNSRLFFIISIQTALAHQRENFGEIFVQLFMGKAKSMKKRVYSLMGKGILALRKKKSLSCIEHSIVGTRDHISVFTVFEKKLSHFNFIGSQFQSQSHIFFLALLFVHNVIPSFLIWFKRGDHTLVLKVIIDHFEKHFCKIIGKFHPYPTGDLMRDRNRVIQIIQEWLFKEAAKRNILSPQFTSFYGSSPLTKGNLIKRGSFYLSNFSRKIFTAIEIERKITVSSSILKRRKESLLEKLKKTSVSLEVMENLLEGYKELKQIIEKLKPEKPILICIDGKISTGKSLFSEIIMEFIRRDISKYLISMDSLQKKFKDKSQVCVQLKKKITQVSKDYFVIIIEGLGSFYYLKKIGFIAHIGIIMEANDNLRLRRHIKKCGPIGYRYFEEWGEEEPENIKAENSLLFIKNNAHLCDLLKDLLKKHKSFNLISQNEGLPEGLLKFIFKKHCPLIDMLLIKIRFSTSSPIDSKKGSNLVSLKAWFNEKKYTKYPYNLWEALLDKYKQKAQIYKITYYQKIVGFLFCIEKELKIKIKVRTNETVFLLKELEIALIEIAHINPFIVKKLNQFLKNLAYAYLFSYPIDSEEESLFNQLGFRQLESGGWYRINKEISGVTEEFIKEITDSVNNNSRTISESSSSVRDGIRRHIGSWERYKKEECLVDDGNSNFTLYSIPQYYSLEEGYGEAIGRIVRNRDKLKTPSYICAIGSFSCAGKSTFSEQISLKLQKSGIPCLVIDQDNWILRKGKRFSNAFPDKFALRDFFDFVRKIKSGKKAFMPLYHPRKRRLRIARNRFLRKSADVVTSEGRRFVRYEKLSRKFGKPVYVEITYIHKEKFLDLFTEVTPQKGVVVIFEGALVFYEPSVYSLFDLRIFLYVPFAVQVQRKIVRGRERWVGKYWPPTYFSIRECKKVMMKAYFQKYLPYILPTINSCDLVINTASKEDVFYIDWNLIEGVDWKEIEKLTYKILQKVKELNNLREKEKISEVLLEIDKEIPEVKIGDLVKEICFSILLLKEPNNELFEAAVKFICEFYPNFEHNDRLWEIIRWYERIGEYERAEAILRAMGKEAPPLPPDGWVYGKEGVETIVSLWTKKGSSSPFTMKSRLHRIILPFRDIFKIEYKCIVKESLPSFAQVTSYPHRKLVFLEYVVRKFSDEYILSILSHELSHFILAHKNSSPKNEFEADILGIYMMAKTGIHPKDAVDIAIEVLKERKNAENRLVKKGILVSSLNYKLTHPPVEERIKKLLLFRDKLIVSSPLKISLIACSILEELGWAKGSCEWVKKNTPHIFQRTIVSSQMEIGLVREVFRKVRREARARGYSTEEIKNRIIPQLAQLTMAGGLGALMPDLIKGLADNGVDVVGITPLYSKWIKGGEAVDEKYVKILLSVLDDTGIVYKIKDFEIKVYFYKLGRARLYFLYSPSIFDGLYPDPAGGVRRTEQMVIFRKAQFKLLKILKQEGKT
ncbi:MAG: hypothetical protein B6D55_04810, partial [Candidatus Omnitrophica bacterium 4484_70.2]